MARKPKAAGTVRPPRRAMVVDPLCHEDLRYWVREQPKIAEKIICLMAEVIRDPFAGTGKPEPLKGLGTNVWSRRITQEHRLVYMVSEDRIDFLQARYHY
ncbi:Txe/YoeB family addiction module toxin [Gemmatimonas sp.]|uniref:Txe/YoeB family addiction module toxin n=1 Tax=Gemmatimonas sp. TaxID=1962908 RepID=UPI003F717AC5